MVIRDGLRNELKEGDIVSFSLGLNQTVAARIETIRGGLGAPGTVDSIPSIIVSILLPVQVAPNGVASGILKLAQPSSSSVVSAG